MKKYLAILLFISFNIYGQASRTWVSGVGDDANPCSRTAPCKTFAGAISKTAPAGEISVLDPGGFGAVTITKSITISGDGTLAGILAAGTNGVIINVAATDKVVLRNLSIEGFKTGLNGIRFLAGGELVVENCTINNFKENGISADMTTGNAKILISNTSILGFLYPSSIGLKLLQNNSTANLRVSVVGSRIQSLDSAIVAHENTNLSVMNSVVSSNLTGIKGKGSAKVLLQNSQIFNNGTALISLGNSELSLSGSAMTNNTIGASGDKLILSFGNNTILNNPTSAPLGVMRLD
ncbi:hypothetical protein EGI26_18955 [Lacihabitans sp. CCS-44]|uniref:hypothetical protein n=1 Tax=Lacihabitans sp. CCS-44 TaxID=2487331 RepID=UPI0020CB983B|nr:hypothetical protein [Lacihabitans sp. CCS-44]MCP9757244.1 hypothetical protein [Lacihabitans sp. CCS-44]